MKIHSISPWVLAAIGTGISLLSLVVKGSFDPYILAFFFMAAIIEIFARRQKRIPSILITFVVPLAIIIFLRTNIITIKKLQNSTAEPYIHKGSSVFYQPNFYSIRNNDLIIIKNYEGSRNLICRVLDVREQSLKLEIISRSQIIDTTKENIEGKIVVYDMKNGNEGS